MYYNNYQIVRIIIGCIGILSILSHIIAAILWIAYIIGWRIIRKLKYIQQRQEINQHSSMTPYSTITNTISYKNNVNAQQQQHRQQRQQEQQSKSVKLCKQHLTWPICSLRMSTQIIILSMEMINIIGCFDLIRLIYLSMTGNDLRLLTNDWLCRIQIFLSFISCDISGWHFVCLCIERCYITLYPKKLYSMNHDSIGPALLMIIIVYIISILSNIFLLITKQPICSGIFRNNFINIIKFSITFIIPVLIVTISTIVMIIVLIKWKLNNNKFSMKTYSYHNHSITINKTINNSMNKKQTSNLSLIHTNSIINQLKHRNLIHYSNRKQSTFIKLIIYNISARITVAKMMLICAILYLINLLSLFLFGSIYDDYCCFLVAKINNHWNDNLFNLMSILYWFIQSITSYVLMLGAISIRHDIQIMIKNAAFALPILAFMSASDPPFSMMMLSSYNNNNNNNDDDDGENETQVFCIHRN
ncbi:hypothetical protein MS3_00004365 [Schistosoma haematobium]|uniref:Uncharacterized protein n=1 Tax=Schistosoma haematobium TaxID=6185 RepID=A0A6A5DKJ8_SCHHA|nr:hypothetical protein MS3_00004365 [Schistosoma haematobium]KAH9594171.1 hypothetical protein MS3_00004365 [Schistosoma haematobium]